MPPTARLVVASNSLRTSASSPVDESGIPSGDFDVLNKSYWEAIGFISELGGGGRLLAAKRLAGFEGRYVAYLKELGGRYNDLKEGKHVGGYRDRGGQR